MNESRMFGSVKFYSTEKGYGFIYREGEPDTFFHITDVDDPLPPAVGTIVSFLLETDRRSQRPCAKHVKFEEIERSARSEKKRPLALDGFPCVRGGGISGFVVKESLGNIRVGRGWFSSSFGSANSARDQLISDAKGMGANAIINFVWHNDCIRTKGFFGWYVDNRFWAEGEAVVLVAKG